MITANYDLTRDMVSLDLVQPVGPANVAVGLCYAKINQAFVTAAGGGDFSGMPGPIVVTRESYFTGWGLHLGASATKTFGNSGIGLYGAADAAVLTGRMTVNHSTALDSSWWGDRDLEDNITESARALVPMFKVDAGLSWNLKPVTVDIGYQYEYWINAVGYMHFGDYDDRFDITTTKENLALHGPHVGVQVAF